MSTDLKTLIKQSPTLLVVTHDGNLHRKLNKALEKHANGTPVHEVNVYEDEAAQTLLHVSDLNVTVLGFAGGNEVARIERPNPKDIQKVLDAVHHHDPSRPPSVKPVHVTEGNFQAEVLRSELPVLLDLWAPWCGPCRAIAPVIEQLAGELNGKVKVGKLNTDENREIMRQYRVMGIPTLLVFKDGQVIGRMVGARPARAIRSSLADLLNIEL